MHRLTGTLEPRGIYPNYMVTLYKVQVDCNKGMYTECRHTPSGSVSYVVHLSTVVPFNYNPFLLRTRYEMYMNIQLSAYAEQNCVGNSDKWGAIPLG